MVDSSLATVEGAALTQGIAFLYAQAGELLKRRRAARDKDEMPQEGALPALELPAVVFETAGGTPAAPVPAVVDSLTPSLLEARRAVEDYIFGTAALDPGSPVAQQAVDLLRGLLEEVYGTAVTFRGEQRRPSAGTSATRVNARQIGVYVSGDARIIGDVAGRDVNKRA